MFAIKVFVTHMSSLTHSSDLLGVMGYTVFQNPGRPLFLAGRLEWRWFLKSMILCWTLAVVRIQIFPRPFQKVFDYCVTSQDSLISYEQTELISLECITTERGESDLFSPTEENPSKVSCSWSRWIWFSSSACQWIESGLIWSGPQLPANLNKSTNWKHVCLAETDSFLYDP